MSLKFRLAFINTFFVILSLGLALSLLVFQSRRVFIESIDREMLNRAERIMNNPQMRDREKPLVPGIRNNAMPVRDDQNFDPNQPPGPRPNQPGNELGPDFSGPPNDDIARPIAITVDGQAVELRNPRILDRVAIQNKNLQHPIIATVPVEGITTRVITVPLLGQGKLVGFAQYGHDLKDFDRLKDTQVTTIVLLIPFAIVFSGLIGWLLAGAAVRPIEKFAEASTQISASDMSTRLPTKGNDEIAKLGQSFNAMIDRLQLSFEERQRLFEELQNTLEQQKQFVGDASHELRTPLARLRITTSSALEQESTPDEMKEALEIADRETEHMSQLVDQLLTLARLDSGYKPKREPVNLSDIAREAGAKFPSNEPNAVRLELQSDPIIYGDHDGLVRAVINLLENARRYSPDHSILLTTHQAQDQAVLTVKDQGCGIAPEHLPHLTERFYRVDDARNRKLGGTGLGLAIVKSIVEANEGHLSIQSKVGEGTTINLIFPISKQTFEAK